MAIERSDLSFETENFSVTHYHSDPDKLIIVFISAGRQTPGGAPIEEFRNSLRGLGTSILFVADQKILWFNHAEADEVFGRIAAIADRYSYVGAMGESMGGSGALLATKYMSKISRVLAMSPQYSIAAPFIRFDLRYEGIGRHIQHHFHDGFAPSSLPQQTVIVFGNTEWPDHIHAMAFTAHRLDVIFIEGATHNVAAFLKGSPSGNQLIRLLEAFADFTRPFAPVMVRSLLSNHVSQDTLQSGKSFIDFYAQRRMILKGIDAQISAEAGVARSPNVSIGKPATQSSVCSWSRYPDSPSKDAAGAVSGEVTGSYSFHTDVEASPWWSVDLQNLYRIDEVRIFNFVASRDVAIRTAKFVLEASIEGITWRIIHERVDEEPFGGVDGAPFVWRPADPVFACRLRIRLTAPNYLHLDQVEVFGKLA